MDDKRREKIMFILMNGIDADQAGAVAMIAERLCDLVLENKPIMQAPRLCGNNNRTSIDFARARNRVTLLAAVAMGAQWVLIREQTYFFFATKEGLNVRLRQMGLPEFDDPDQPSNMCGPYGSLNERSLHYYT